MTTDLLTFRVWCYRMNDPMKRLQAVEVLAPSSPDAVTACNENFYAYVRDVMPGEPAPCSARLIFNTEVQRLAPSADPAQPPPSYYSPAPPPLYKQNSDWRSTERKTQSAADVAFGVLKLFVTLILLGFVVIACLLIPILWIPLIIGLVIWLLTYIITSGVKAGIQSANRDSRR